MQYLKLDWVHVQFKESSVNELSDNTKGVYIIWYSNVSKPQTIYVGLGQIKSRFQEHLKDISIKFHCVPGGLGDRTVFFSYIEVLERFQGGIENYLAGILEPKVGEKWSEDPKIEVNLPWEIQ